MSRITAHFQFNCNYTTVVYQTLELHTPACDDSICLHLSSALLDLSQKDGLVVLGVPCSDFGNQEPWEEAKILEFYQTKVSTAFFSL
jgi:Glutathione peroxidase